MIDKHISDGKKNAGRFNDRPYNSRPVADGFQELLERTLRYQSELLPLWLEVLGSAVKMDPARMPFTPRPDGPPASDGTANRGSKAISIEMASSRPVQISLDLQENSETLPLICLGLRAVDHNKPALSDISFTPVANRNAVKLRISILDTHPSGTYSGVIVNGDTGETRGTLSVSIAE